MTATRLNLRRKYQGEPYNLDSFVKKIVCIQCIGNSSIKAMTVRCWKSRLQRLSIHEETFARLSNKSINE